MGRTFTTSIPPATESASDIPQFRALADNEVPARLAETLAKWRKLAAEFGFIGPVAWLVPAGFTLKKHAPLAGPCYQEFKYLQGWSLKDEEREATESQVAFWIPRVIPESNSKTVREQIALLAAWRQKHDLPAHHLASFGKASLLSGLMLAHYELTQEKTPLNEQWTRTDTLLSGGGRLGLGGRAGEWLHCGWHWRDGYRSSDLWCFPLGAEALEPGELGI